MSMDIKNYSRYHTFNEKVVIGDITPIGGWGVGRARIEHLFPFYFCEIELWHQAWTECPLEEFMDVAAEVPVYYFLSWDSAVQFAKTKSNRYPIERRMWWLRFQDQYWFSTILMGMLDTIRYLSSEERIQYLDNLKKLSGGLGNRELKR